MIAWPQKVIGLLPKAREKVVDPFQKVQLNLAATATLGTDESGLYNLRSGSIFVSLWELHSSGQDKTKISAVAVRENVWEPLKLGLISGYGLYKKVASVERFISQCMDYLSAKTKKVTASGEMFKKVWC